MDAGATVLLVRDLHFAFPDVPLFKGWSGNIPAGVTLMQGDEGTGKTTLLKLLAGELAAASGKLEAGVATLHRDPAAYRSAVFRTDPRSEAHNQITARQFFMSLQGRYPALDLDAAMSLADAFALTAHLEKPMYMLSTGTKRKVWLTAAFAANTLVTLLDEPFAALDKSSVALVLELLTEAAENPTRAWVIADYTAPQNVRLTHRIALGNAAP